MTLFHLLTQKLYPDRPINVYLMSGDYDDVPKVPAGDDVEGHGASQLSRLLLTRSVPACSNKPSHALLIRLV
jgi:hypothetical protein